MSLLYTEEFGWSDQENMALQKYLLLQSQNEALQEYLDQLRTSAASTAATSATTSPSMSPTRDSSSRKHHSRSHHRRSLPPPPSSRRGHALETVIDETTLYEIAAQEQQLFDIHEAMKRSLTELLNSDAVRTDRPYRTWVQGRLMEVEKALRSGRRRRSH